MKKLLAKIRVTNSVFLIGTFVTTCTAVPLYIWHYGLDAFQAALFLFFFVSTGMSITLGYHRLFSHLTFEASPLVKIYTLLFGAAAFAGSALGWCADHRRHHKHVDHDEDPYDISRGLFHAHIGWLLFRRSLDTPLTWVRDLQKDRLAWLQHEYYVPTALLMGFALPAAIGMVVAWPHIGEGVRNYPAVVDAVREFHPPTYLVDRFVKPLLYFFSFAFLLANAVRDSRQPERFIAVLAMSAVAPALAVFWTVAQYPGSLAELARDREFMAPRGMHANEFGLLLALLCGPLLFVAGDSGRGRWRVLALCTLALVVPALLLTFSRGGLLAALIAFVGFLWHQRRLKTLLLSAALAGLALLASPDELQERFSTGLRAGALADTQQVDRDDLTAGRVNGWKLLAPEVLDSPWIGRGLGSTQWSAAVAAGRYRANHPHNIYLEVLMDLGLLGFAAMAACYAFFLRRLRALADEPALGPELRSFFLGARWALWGALAMAVTTAYYMPNPAQTYLWFALGMAFAFAPAAVPARAGVTDARRAAAAGAAP